jgi:hypothetical protein
MASGATVPGHGPIIGIGIAFNGYGLGHRTRAFIGPAFDPYQSGSIGTANDAPLPSFDLSADCEF